MQQSLQILPKKVRKSLRLFYSTLRKGISNNKLWLDLNMMMKRAKIKGKSLQNLLFHNHHAWAAAFALNRPSHHLSFPSHPPPLDEYEFSCNTTPNIYNPLSLFSLHKKHQPETVALDVTAFNAAMLKAMEMIHSEAASPALPGFGRSPVVRQLRVTDSPFPVNYVDEDNHVDEDAERFISRFYSDLRRQKRICGSEITAV